MYCIKALIKEKNVKRFYEFVYLSLRNNAITVDKNLIKKLMIACLPIYIM